MTQYLRSDKYLSAAQFTTPSVNSSYPLPSVNINCNVSAPSIIEADADTATGAGTSRRGAGGRGRTESGGDGGSSDGGKGHATSLNNGKPLTLDDISKNLKSTLNTLSLILIYLGISLPSYVVAAINVNCYATSECLDLHYYIFIFTGVTFLGHLIFPINWILQDKMYTNKLKKTYRIFLGIQ